MASIPSTLNFVNITFKDCVVNDIDQKLLDALNEIIRTGFPPTNLVQSLFISSANDSHDNKPNSRHNQKKAIDISRINGKFISLSYGRDPEVTEIVQRIQNNFEQVRGRRENFGPYLKNKLGRPYSVGGHHDHIHLSVD